jgi:hypothetical protein
MLKSFADRMDRFGDKFGNTIGLAGGMFATGFGAMMLASRTPAGAMLGASTRNLLGEVGGMFMGNAVDASRYLDKLADSIKNMDPALRSSIANWVTLATVAAGGAYAVGKGIQVTKAVFSAGAEVAGALTGVGRMFWGGGAGAGAMGAITHPGAVGGSRLSTIGRYGAGAAGLAMAGYSLYAGSQEGMSLTPGVNNQFANTLGTAGGTMFTAGMYLGGTPAGIGLMALGGIASVASIAIKSMASSADQAASAMGNIRPVSRQESEDRYIRAVTAVAGFSYGQPVGAPSGPGTARTETEPQRVQRRRLQEEVVGMRVLDSLYEAATPVERGARVRAARARLQVVPAGETETQRNLRLEQLLYLQDIEQHGLPSRRPNEATLPVAPVPTTAQVPATTIPAARAAQATMLSQQVRDLDAAIQMAPFEERLALERRQLGLARQWDAEVRGQPLSIPTPASGAEGVLQRMQDTSILNAARANTLPAPPVAAGGVAELRDLWSSISTSVGGAAAGTAIPAATLASNDPAAIRAAMTQAAPSWEAALRTRLTELQAQTSGPGALDERTPEYQEARRNLALVSDAVRRHMNVLAPALLRQNEAAVAPPVAITPAQVVQLPGAAPGQPAGAAIGPAAVLDPARAAIAQQIADERSRQYRPQLPGGAETDAEYAAAVAQDRSVREERIRQLQSQMAALPPPRTPAQQAAIQAAVAGQPGTAYPASWATPAQSVNAAMLLILGSAGATAAIPFQNRQIDMGSIHDVITQEGVRDPSGQRDMEREMRQTQELIRELIGGQRKLNETVNSRLSRFGG